MKGCLSASSVVEKNELPCACAAESREGAAAAATEQEVPMLPPSMKSKRGERRSAAFRRTIVIVEILSG